MMVTVGEVLATASRREAVRPSDGKSTSTFESVTVDGERYFLKRLSPNTDWIMRLTGDHVHRPYLVWQAGIMAAVPRDIDHTVVAMELAGEGDDAELSILMRDVSRWLVPEGDTHVSPAVHRLFLDRLACLSHAFWGFRDTIGGLTPMSSRIRFFAPDNIAPELEVAEPPGPVAAADAGWAALAERAPAMWDTVRVILDDPAILSEPMARTPVTFLHGDWKMGNLGSHSDGRTILLDWAYPGSGPACWDLAWYLALNSARMPESKEAAIASFRAGLSRRGIEVEPWFQRQLDLCLVGIMCTVGWEKALGDDAELRWWERTVLEAVARQGI
ncbi:MAG: phosphotransferase family protein [Actinomycetales bacterium]